MDRTTVAFAIGAFVCMSSALVAQERPGAPAPQPPGAGRAPGQPGPGGGFGFPGFSGQPAPQKGTVLGVAAVPIPEPFSAQVNLPSGFGLLVEHVVPDSPAANAGVERHDVLSKFNDQLLANPDQLAALVRSHKPGDSIELTVLRRGQETKLQPNLAEGDIRPPMPFGPGGFGGRPSGAPGVPGLPGFPGGGGGFGGGPGGAGPGGFGPHHPGGPEAHMRMLRLHGGNEEIRRHLLELREQLGQRNEPVPADELRRHLDELIRKLDVTGPRPDRAGPRLQELRERLRHMRQMRGQANPEQQEQIDQSIKQLETEIASAEAANDAGFVALTAGNADTITTVASRNLSLVYSDGEHSLKVTGDSTGRRLLVKDQEGRTLFEGPIDTAEQRGQVPSEVRVKLQKLEDTTRLQFDGDVRVQVRESRPQ